MTSKEFWVIPAVQTTFSTPTRDRISPVPPASLGGDESRSFASDGAGGEGRSETAARPGLTLTVRYTYDALGGLQTLTYPDNRAVAYGYDGLSRVTSITNNGVALVSAIKYNDWGNRYLTRFA